MAAAVELIQAADAVVLVVLMPAAVQLARAGSFVVAVPNEGEFDEQKAAAARQIVEEAPRVPASAATTRPRESRRPTNRWPGRSMRSPRRLTPDWLSGASAAGAPSAVLSSVACPAPLAAHTRRPLLNARQRPL
jgi:hypothetical protein